MDPFLISFVTIAGALFITELTDKDALLILSVATRVSATIVFLAGAVAFVFDTAVIVSLGALLLTIVPIFWVRSAGGAVMLVYGLWEARGLAGKGTVDREESRIKKSGSTWKVFLTLLGSLIVLDLAGDATEILTIVFVAQYVNALLVFVAGSLGLVAATAVETALGNRLGKILTPRRIRFGSMLVFLALGAAIILSTYFQ
ncbi:MAG TPA: TMEM165/GDT1 family protein [Nitrososphaerales archaeon]|nr:TMEM165/GDT1 family protein [Nitrososphaerales archaeon]